MDNGVNGSKIVESGYGLVYSTAYSEPYDNCYHDLYNDLFYRDVVFKGKTGGYYVEVGALDGVVNSQSFIFEKTLEWDGIVVEPNPHWETYLPNNRKCHISNSAISSKIGTATFECRENYGFSGLKSSSNEARYSDIVREVEVETISLTNLFDRYNAPNVIDWVSIDTEGAEIDILNQFFSEDSKYKINLLSFETHQFLEAEDILSKQPFLKIKNPYLDFVKISNAGLLKFNPTTGQLYKTPFVDRIYNDVSYIDVTYEHYYIHLDYLKDNLHLKKFLI